MKALGSHCVLSGGADAATAEARFDIVVLRMLTGLGNELCKSKWFNLRSGVNAVRTIFDSKAGCRSEVRRPDETMEITSQTLME